MSQSGLPPVRAEGRGQVESPVSRVVADYGFHYAEFLSRGLAPDEADRLARAVVARDTTPSKE
jgi:hypothetical protein